MNNKMMHMLAWVLLVIGGLQLGLLAFNVDVLGYLGSTLMKIVYILIGLSALYELFTHKKNCSACHAQNSL